MKKHFFALATLLLVTTQALAQGSSMATSAGPTLQTLPAEMDNRVSLDAGPGFILGAGLDYERTIFSTYTLGAMVSYMHFGTFDFIGDPGPNHAVLDDKVLMYGIRGRYFFGHRPDRRSPYLLAGVVATNITGEAYIDDSDYSGSKTQSTTATAHSIGGVIGGGYQWTFGSFFGGTRSVLDIGGLYGDGYTVSTDAQTTDGKTTQINSLRADYGPMIEASYGIMF